jgi:hypothetical protein
MLLRQMLAAGASLYNWSVVSLYDDLAAQHFTVHLLCHAVLGRLLLGSTVLIVTACSC